MGVPPHNPHVLGVGGTAVVAGFRPAIGCARRRAAVVFFEPYLLLESVEDSGLVRLDEGYHVRCYLPLRREDEVAALAGVNLDGDASALQVEDDVEAWAHMITPSSASSSSSVGIGGSTSAVWPSASGSVSG